MFPQKNLARNGLKPKPLTNLQFLEQRRHMGLTTASSASPG